MRKMRAREGASGKTSQFLKFPVYPQSLALRYRYQQLEHPTSASGNICHLQTNWEKRRSEMGLSLAQRAWEPGAPLEIFQIPTSSLPCSSALRRLCRPTSLPSLLLAQRQVSGPEVHSPWLCPRPHTTASSGRPSLANLGCSPKFLPSIMAPHWRRMFPGNHFS